MAACDSSLMSKLRNGKPNQKVHLIIHPARNTSLAQAANLLKAANIEVRHMFTPTHSVAARASIAQALRLNEFPWIGRIEEDKTVTTM